MQQLPRFGNRSDPRRWHQMQADLACKITAGFRGAPPPWRLTLPTLRGTRCLSAEPTEESGNRGMLGQPAQILQVLRGVLSLTTNQPTNACYRLYCSTSTCQPRSRQERDPGGDGR